MSDVATHPSRDAYEQRRGAHPSRDAHERRGQFFQRRIGRTANPAVRTFKSTFVNASHFG